MKIKFLLITIFLSLFFSCSDIDKENVLYVERETKELKVEKVPKENWINFLYNNPFGKLELNLIVKRKFLTSIYGKYMNTSFSKKMIPKFVEELEINMDESEKNIDEFVSFNDFFYRKLKKDSRKINFNENVFVSPSDGKILVFNNILSINDLYIKGKKFSLEKFLNDFKMYEKYKNGMMAIVRLSPKDYHRVHFPSDGYISKSKPINGYYYSVSPIAVKNNLNIFFENKREISELKTKNFGDVLLIEVGATMVGGIKQIYKENSFIKKGDEKSYFYFGGSTIILLFEENKIKFDNDLLENTLNNLETTIKFGEKIAEKI